MTAGLAIFWHCKAGYSNAFGSQMRSQANAYQQQCTSIESGNLMPAGGRQPSLESVVANLLSLLVIVGVAIPAVIAGGAAVVFAVFAAAAHAIGEKLGLMAKDEFREPVDSVWRGLLPFLLVVLVCCGLATLVAVTR
ncbi:hypothetical protein [Nocardia abscessus]|uniref:hypothetical protein n=1 Tax=Nocardia abscessus TaxID=120957 RepID=UPI0012FB3FDE|nr:hypothetical protein [Nocardia abscessus]MCC3328105.1 hypothetical protein [Nocardia abscessus]